MSEELEAPVIETPTAETQDAPPTDAPNTILNPETGDPAPVVTPEANAGDVKPFYQTMPENWRNQAVEALGVEGEEAQAKMLNRLNRFKDLPTLIKSGFDSMDKIRSGEISTGLPENPTDEQVAEYRAANDIPEQADAYELKLSEGLTLGDDDMAIMEGVKQAAHSLNISNGALSAVTEAMLKGRQAQIEQQQAADKLEQQQNTQTLKTQLGGDFQRTVNMAQARVDSLPEGVREEFAGARTASGKVLLNDPSVISWLADAESKINPTAMVVPDSSNPAQTIKDEIKALESKMGTPEWYKDNDAQQRYLELTAAQERLNA